MRKTKANGLDAGDQKNEDQTSVDDDLLLDEDEDEGAEDEVDEDDDDDDSDDDEETGDDDEDDEQTALVNAVTAGVLKGIDTKIESAIDRRINVVLREIRGGEKSTKSAAGSKQPTKKEEGTVTADVREVRLAFRDALSDQRFASPEERKFALELGRAKIAAAAAEGIDDADEVGEQIADDVVKQIVGLRKHYTTSTKAALKRRGVLTEEPGQAPKRGTSKRGAAISDFKTGAQRAAERHARAAATKS